MHSIIMARYGPKIESRPSIVVQQLHPLYCYWQSNHVLLDEYLLQQDHCLEKKGCCYHLKVLLLTSYYRGPCPPQIHHTNHCGRLPLLQTIYEFFKVRWSKRCCWEFEGCVMVTSHGGWLFLDILIYFVGNVYTAVVLNLKCGYKAYISRPYTR